MAGLLRSNLPPVRYTKAMASAIRNIKVPYDLVVDMVEQGTWIEIRVYENQVLALSDSQWEEALIQLLRRRDIIRTFGVKCELHGVAGEPPALR